MRGTDLGISPDQLPAVFEIVSQAQGGLGRGATLAKSFVEMHGGTIEARTRGMGQGSEFVVSLPTTEPVPQAFPEPQHSQNGAPARRRVLVVDDTRAVAFLLGKLLESLGQDVEICYDAATAVEAARHNRPDMVFSDIAMPHMDGYQLARQLRSEGLKDVTLVGLTGYGQESDRRRAQEAGFHHHLVKPVSLATLQKLLDG